MPHGFEGVAEDSSYSVEVLLVAFAPFFISPHQQAEGAVLLGLARSYVRLRAAKAAESLQGCRPIQLAAVKRLR